MNKITFFLLLLSAISASAQVSIVSKHNFNFVKGVYSSKSQHAQSLQDVKEEISPQLEMRPDQGAFAFMFPPHTGVLLFKSKNLSDPGNITGKLSAATVVRIDTIFCNQAYLSPKDSLFSFDICYALNINGKRYYTDFRPHDFVPFKRPLLDHGQLFCLAGQSTGYDMYADNGYPDLFHIVVFQKAGNSIQLIFESGQLPFRYEDEFWEDEESMKWNYDTGKKELRIEIKGNPGYKAVWDGRELKQN